MDGRDLTVADMADPGERVRRYTIARGDPLTIEIHGADGSRLLVRGVIDGVPESAGRIAQTIRVRDAVARPLDS